MAEHHKQRRTLAPSLEATVLGFGAASLGDLFHKISNTQALATVEKAVELGIGYFDTAPWYGLGLSEARLGLGLSAFPRDEYQLSTKVGRRLTGHQNTETWESIGFAGGLQNDREFAYDYDDFMRQYEDSVQRLGTGRVEALVIHDIEEAEGETPLHPRGARANLVGPKGGYRALEQLRASGKIKAFGAGINYAVGTHNHTAESYRQWNVDYFEFLVGLAAEGERPLDFVLLAGTHSLLNYSAWEDGIIARCDELGIKVVLGGALGTGILATGAVAGAKYNYEDATEEVLAKVGKIEEVCKKFEIPIAAAALQFPLGSTVVTTVIAGMAAPHEVVRAVETMNVRIPPEFWTTLKSQGLLPAGIPVPSPACP